VRTLVVSGTNLFAGTTGKVFLSTDSGDSWTDISDGLDETYFLSLAVDGTFIYAGTNCLGAWKRPLSELVGTDETAATCNRMNLFPNPAADVITVSLEKTVKQGLIMDFYTISGVLAKTVILDQDRQHLSVSDLPAGIYLIRIGSGGLKQKLVIQR